MYLDYNHWFNVFKNFNHRFTITKVYQAEKSVLLLAAVCGHRIGGAGGAGQMVRLVGLVTRTI
jgi:hypothetical protein